MKTRVLTCLAISLLILGSAGCSSSSSSGSTSVAVIEANVEIVMSVVGALIQELEPFPPAPAIGFAGECSVIPDNAELCTDSGSISDCGNGSFMFNDCASSEGSIAIATAGSLQFTKGVDWPTGTRDLDLTADGSMANYLMTFDGSDVATVIYSDDVADASCTVNMNPPVFADCAFIP